jgi:hypothetical protein
LGTEAPYSLLLLPSEWELSVLKFILIISMVGHSDFIVPRLLHEVEHCEQLAAQVKATAAKTVPPTAGTITHICYAILDEN